MPPPESTSARSRSRHFASIVLAWRSRHRTEGRLDVTDEELLEDEDLWRDDDAGDHAGWWCVRTDPFPVPGERLHVRRRVHDRRAPRARLAGARRPEPALARAAREGGRAQPAGRLLRVAASARARRTTPGRPPGRPVHGIKSERRCRPDTDTRRYDRRVATATDTLHVDGIRCERCVMRLASALEGAHGLENAHANLMGDVTLTWDDELTSREALAGGPRRRRLPRAQAGNRRRSAPFTLGTTLIR